MAITWPSNTTDIIDQIRGAIGRNVTFIVEGEKELCPRCDIDPITNLSIDSLCPVCSGAGYITIYDGVTLSGHVTWNFSELVQWHTGGQIQSGDCRVQIKYTVSNAETVNNSKWVLVDGREMLITKITLRGVQGINRILVDLIERKKS